MGYLLKILPWENIHVCVSAGERELSGKGTRVRISVSFHNWGWAGGGEGWVVLLHWVMEPRIQGLRHLIAQSLSCVWLFVTSWTAAWGLPCPSPSPGACSNSCPLSRWWHPNISSSVSPFSFCLQSSQHQGLFQLGGSSHQMAKVF